MQTVSKAPRWNPWPLSIIAYFTVAILGCGTFVVYCNRHPADLVAADYYEQEMRYQGQIDRIQHAQERAQLASVTYDADRSQLRIALPPHQSRENATGQIQLYRPAAMDQDRHVRLEPDARGVQTIDTRDLRPGLWKARVSWTSDRQDYFLDQSWTNATASSKSR
jgi:hypothetical protein